MTYQVLARKWRPQDFASLVGQEPIVTALTNALTEHRVAQAYLFSGIRGVGKTTAARVFAKALNCEREPGSAERPGADPCNECRPCRQITSGADIDVLEIDAATYSKVEQVRELTESLRYAAANARYKVVVLDEVHRLSRQAFDALLKIVEEPPAHLVFIFATTEIDAVPATLLSRCQEFQFRRVPSPVLAAHLKRIAGEESIRVSEAALKMIARAGEGSVRDSVALLDQLATFGGGEISDQDANRLLGGLDAEIFRRLLGGILGGDPATITAIVGEIEENGWDPHHVYSQFLAYVRDALHLVLGGKPEAVDLPLEESRALADTVSGTSHESLLQLAQLLLTGEMTVRRSEFALLALEIAWLRAAELPKVVRVEDLLSGRAAVGTAVEPQVANAAPPAPRRANTKSRAAESDASGDGGEEANRDDANRDEANRDETSSDPVERLRKILAERPSLSARFNGVHLEIRDKVVSIRSENDPAALAKALEGKTHAKFFAEALVQVCGEGARYELREAPRSVGGSLSQPANRTAPADPDRTAPPNPDQEKYEKHPAVRAVLDVFPGKIRSIEPRRSGQET